MQTRTHVMPNHIRPYLSTRFSGKQCAQPLRYGLRMEHQLRRGLQEDGRLRVHYSPEADRIFKLDLVAFVRNEPTLPAVGVQFTTRYDPAKEWDAMVSVKRSGVVARFLYLQASCPLDQPAVSLISDMIRHVATLPRDRGIVYGTLASDKQGQCCWKELRCFPFETSDKPEPQKEEEGIAS